MTLHDFIKMEDRLYALNVMIENAMYREGVDYGRDISPLEAERARLMREIKLRKDEVLSFEVDTRRVRDDFVRGLG